ncbi:MAG: 23S rRNA (pseudouridine(1915)-N(3))-methyltransferase RlmH [Desulfobulbaceae bacterium]|jgi:23S rRNA (pseudouridine1915-N3)-methyltransferase|nr:23S rRNA (pseudouridine(1915)-N(3))-methyltransferase RlmH [Desulfobulbaceae bacterium]MDY0350544.1 23S rRNA (pseudouridine(1915)-N(3))-methyltransferase RlmH [Desulfobulbaceae bacterium]
MRFVFPFLGKTAQRYLEEGIADFAARLGRFVQVEMVVLRDKASRRLPDDLFRQREAEQLLERCADASCLVALDAGGRQLDSEELAGQITEWENRGMKSVHFLIGGHLGLHPDVIRRADLVLSLSRMTFTHEMTRLILMEQLYRAWMIKSGRRYHN